MNTMTMDEIRLAGLNDFDLNLKVYKPPMIISIILSGRRTLPYFSSATQSRTGWLSSIGTPEFLPPARGIFSTVKWLSGSERG